MLTIHDQDSRLNRGAFLRIGSADVNNAGVAEGMRYMGLLLDHAVRRA
jgi:hypothetical protein